MRAITAMLALAAAGCTAHADTGPLPGGGGTEPDESITYSTGACFGACPVYTVTVTPTGGSFEGKRFTAVTGTQSFAVTPAQYRAFADALERVRPGGERLVRPGSPECKLVATDMASADVRWSDGDHLAVYYGCHDEPLRPLRDALRAAPGLLPIADLIGRH